jgi:hypothetical protein
LLNHDLSFLVLFLLPLLFKFLDESIGDTGRDFPVFLKFHGKLSLALSQGTEYRGIAEHLAEGNFGFYTGIGPFFCGRGYYTTTLVK